MSLHKIFFLLPLLAGLLFFLISCGTTQRLHERNSGDNSSDIMSAEPPKLENNGRDIKLKAQKIKAISHAELSSLKLIEQGVASWYGAKFDGQLTASGEIYDMYELTAAHRTLPFNTIVLVKNVDNGRTAVVRINDRGPYAHGRIIDVSKKAARKLGLIGTGTAHVKLYTLENAVPESSVENIKVETYTIQLGSYQDETQAFKHASRIRGTRVEIAFVNDQKVFRVYYGLYLKRKRANEVLNTLTHRNIHGYVKQVENG